MRNNQMVGPGHALPRRRTHFRAKLGAATLALALMCAIALAQDRPIDIHRSTITIHVGKAGLFSVAGHEHWVNAPISSGVLNDSSPRVEFQVETARLEVKPDPKVDAKTQADVQKAMQENVLESVRYPEISFRSSRIEKQSEGQWQVTGELSLHGVMKPVSLSVKRDSEAYTGHIVIRQTDFGIKPITAAAGAVKVKNELEIDFRIFSEVTPK
jgi:polyisoprenoid-binding protein YceI